MLKTKRFELIVTVNEDDTCAIESSNDGFKAVEILGFLEIKRQDIIEQINRPDKFKHTRTTVVDGEQISIEDVE